MQMIEDSLRAAGETIVHATIAGVRVHGGTAYSADTVDDLDVTVLYFVECAPKGGRPAGSVVIDHHRPGDPGYGRPPAEYAEASSLGQVLRVLGMGMGSTYLLMAAADHCLGAAYRGECPGVDPRELFTWRVEMRAKFQGREPVAVRADIILAGDALREAQVIAHGIRDVRGREIDELVEAAMVEGVAYMATPRDAAGNVGAKVVIGNAWPEQVRWFMGEFAESHGLTGIYGDPARGFAGGQVAR